jgi:hypothetical protein
MKHMNQKIMAAIGEDFVKWLIVKMPAMERRQEYLPALLGRFGVDRMITDANRAPMRIDVTTGRYTPREGERRIGMVNEVCLKIGSVEEYQSLCHQRLKSGNGLKRAPRPKNKVGVASASHSDVTRESRDGVLQLRKGDEVALTNDVEDGCLHSLENVKALIRARKEGE